MRKRTGVNKVCENCGAEFYVPRYRAEQALYCNSVCQGEATKLPPKLRRAKDLFFDQRNAAQHRGIGWELTFKQWWKIWKESGKWEQRGRGKGRYQMARYEDEGVYGVDNVRIITSDANLAERLAPKGELNAFSKLREKDIRAIRALEGKMPRHEVAAKFGINYWHVRDIQKRRCWQHVE